jgi:outer membrane lipoprotein-sorting protein
MKNLFLLLFLLTGTYSFSQQAKDSDPKAQAILDKLSQKMKSLKSFQIEFSASVKNSATGTNESEIGKGWVKGNKFCALYGDNTIISNGIKTWTIVKEDKAIYQSDANENEGDGINPKKLMTIWETGFKNKYEKEEVLNGEKVHVINLYPKDPKKVEYHTIVLYISKVDNELKKAIMKTKDGSVMTYTLNKLIENPDIEDTKFVIDTKKYPGYKIVKN